MALIVGVDRFMSEARALTSTMSNIVASIVVSKWEKAVDEDTLHAELTTGYRKTEEELEHGGDILEDETVEDERRNRDRSPDRKPGTRSSRPADVAARRARRLRADLERRAVGCRLVSCRMRSRRCLSRMVARHRRCAVASAAHHPARRVRQRATCPRSP